MPASACNYYVQYINGWKHKEAKVVLDMRNSKVYLNVTIEREIEPIKPTSVIGVDIGRNNLATLSTGLTFKGKQLEHIRRHYAQVRKGLQLKGTRSAKRRLKALAEGKMVS